jgi:hypothetical protein
MAFRGTKEFKCTFSVGKHEGRGPLGTPRLRWENNIKMDREEIV